ncbi:hypothetical protein HK097_011602 [Rhizophlyctis rosea]|uniref:RING-type domain-containing protein n=1 Tax=Rhizophlyctis rosea TaxID=64517 RepID=A0AAD5S7V9_9FUNG|nr:hypothetical protein HK097_011602 [Rhizophlyctis rosea]
MELKKLAAGPDMAPEPTDDIGTSKPRRGAAVSAAQSFKSGKKGKGQSLVDEHEQLLHRVKAKRIKRNTFSRTTDTLSRKRPRANSEYTDIPICPICNEILPDPDLTNDHIDACLSRSAARSPTPDSESGDGSWEEYTWAGQKRVRATALIEGGYGSATGFQVHKKSDPDLDIDIDIEDSDTEQFGNAQFSEDALKAYQKSEDEEEEPFLSGPSTSQLKHEVDTELNVDSDLPDSEDLRGVKGDMRLVIESLKGRLRDLEQQSQNNPKCLICLDPYKNPLTSIICWHVHCETCWMETLASKRLCPQCQKITAPGDLRRVYL